MKKPTILLLESVTEEALQILERKSNVIIAESPDRGLISSKNQDVDGIITRGKGKVDAELIRILKGLKVIGRCGVGLDNVDVDIASELGIKVINAPGSNADTVAEHTLSLILIAQRKMYDSISEVKGNNWNYRVSYDGDEIRGKTLGVIGMGDIGYKVAQLAKAFGMRVIFCNRTKIDNGFTQKDLSEVLNESDIISIHLALNENTRGLLKASSFSQCIKKPILINTSRGGIISDEEVMAALRKGYLSAFAADVLSQEPPPKDHPLLTMENVYITPHSASLTALTYNEMCVLTANNVLDVLADKKIDSKFIFNKDKMP